jgi:DNA-binding transcriptional MerR regulator
MKNYLTIGQTAGLLNLNPRTLRFYEQIGLLFPANRSAAGYRLYSPEDVARLKFIIRAKEMGLTLKEISSILSLTEKGLCRSVKRQIKELLVNKVKEIDHRIEELRALKDEFNRLQDTVDRELGEPTGEPGSPCSCLPENN